jgi:hypothetical protein
MELHHLTRSTPFIGRMGPDQGWNCRTQAFIISLVASAMHLTSAVMHGRAAFVLGPTADLNPCTLNVKPHAWAAIEGGGMLDVSPSFKTLAEPRLAAWNRAIAFGSRLLPTGNLALTTQPGEFEVALARATHSIDQKTAVYLVGSYDELDGSRLNDGFHIGNSPLTDELAKKYDAAILCNAARHLFDLAYDRADSLQRLSQDAAWEKLARMKVDAVAWLFARMTAGPVYK